jgi:NTE family protein
MEPKEQINLLLPTKKKRLALVLSGGGARGLAHIGVLEVLEENKIPIDAVVGTSMGAVIGGIYAAGKLKEFKEEALKLSHSKMRAMLWNMKFMRPNSDPEKSFGPTLDKFIKNKKFEGLAIDFTAIATDLRTGKEVYLNKGNLTKSILASVCLPGLCHPVEIGKKLLVDGGVVDPLPQGYGEMIAEKVISVNAMPKKYIYKKKKNGVIEVLSDVAGIMTNALLDLEKSMSIKYPEKADKFVFIQLDTEKRKPFDFYNIDDLIKIGRKAAKKHLPEIIALARER